MKKRAKNIVNEIDGLLKDQIHPTKMDMVSIQIILQEAVKCINEKYGLIGDEALDIHNTHTIKRSLDREIERRWNFK